MPYETTRFHPSNHLLRRLPFEEMERIAPYLKRISLVMRQVLVDPGQPVDEVYFIENGLVSLTADTADNGLVEVGMTGPEGLAGAGALLDARAISTQRLLVQVPGVALRIDASRLRLLLETCPALRESCMRYIHFLMTQTSQIAACNARHRVSERLARWLLMTVDRTGSHEMPVTQETLSYMLGVRRAGVSMVATSLQRRGLIQHSRGRIRIMDFAAMEEAACACHGMIRTSQRRILEDLPTGAEEAGEDVHGLGVNGIGVPPSAHADPNMARIQKRTT